MSRLLRLTSAADQRRHEQPSRPPTDEAVWESGLRVRCDRSSTDVANVCIEMRQRGNLSTRMKDYSEWLKSQCAILAKHGRCEISLYSVDMSKNDLTDQDLKKLARTVLSICPRVRVLMLFGNLLSEPAPFVAAIHRGHLRELHLSGNLFTESAVGEIIVAAATAKTADGNWAFPASGDTPLWLRLENQRGRQGGTIPAESLRSISNAGRDPRRIICNLDGSSRTSWCKPNWCTCLRTQPAIHICYFDNIKGIPKQIGRVVQNRADTTNLSTTAIAPWYRNKLARDVRAGTAPIPPSMSSTEDFPPLSKIAIAPCSSKEGGPEEAWTELNVTPGVSADAPYPPPIAALPCKILFGNGADPTFTAGVVDDFCYEGMRL